jgi:hypothetical protein
MGTLGRLTSNRTIVANVEKGVKLVVLYPGPCCPLQRIQRPKRGSVMHFVFFPLLSLCPMVCVTEIMITIHHIQKLTYQTV